MANNRRGKPSPRIFTVPAATGAAMAILAFLPSVGNCQSPLKPTILTLLI